MNEKSSGTLLPSIKGRMITVPNNVHQVIIQDSTVFIGKNHPHRSILVCFRCLIVLWVFGMGVVILEPTLHQLIISQQTNSDSSPTIDRNSPNRFIAAIDNTKRSIPPAANIFGQKELTSTSSKSDITILYSLRDPFSSLNEFFQVTSVYITRANQTTLSFFFQNVPSSTLLKDVSVNDSYGNPLLVNGNFENGSYGWESVYSIEGCYTSSYAYHSSRCHRSGSMTGSTLSQTFHTKPGNELYIGYKLRWDGKGSGVFTKVTIYP